MKRSTPPSSSSGASRAEGAAGGCTTISPEELTHEPTNAACSRRAIGPVTRNIMSRQWSLVLRVPEPLVRDAHAADEPDLAVDHDRAPVVAAVEPRPGAERRLAVALDPPAGLLERAEPIVGRAVAADVVDEHAHRHAAALPLEERVEHLIAHAAVFPHVDHDVDRRARGADVAQQRGQEGVAVVEHLDAAAALERRVDEMRQRLGELRRIHRAKRLVGPHDAAAPRRRRGRRR